MVWFLGLQFVFGIEDIEKWQYDSTSQNIKAGSQLIAEVGNNSG